MPSHGVEIIDGIPVYLKINIMYAFQHGMTPSASPIRLGTYDSDKKCAKWESSETMRSWLSNYQTQLAPRSRK
jgi:hypothetical protein